MIIRGDVVEFGRYEQGNGVKPIEWLVLDRTDKGTLLISKYALDVKPYNKKYTDITWETCTLRKWLNNDFLNAAFSAEERAIISKTRVTADENPEYDTSPGNDTNDKIFLLSITEVNKYFSNSETRKCAPTDYAVANGAYASSKITTGGRGTDWWWLRTPGSRSSNAAYVSYYGTVLYDGGAVTLSRGVVRPALWVDVDKII